MNKKNVKQLKINLIKELEKILKSETKPVVRC